MEQIALSASTRESTGKGAARKLRKENRIPGVLYGPSREPVVLTIKTADLQGALKKSSSENILFGLRIESKGGSETRTVMLKELQVDPIKDRYLHVDFHEISMDKEITVDVAIRLVGTPVGATNGGILQHVRRELSIACLPGNIMEYIECDVSGLDVGDSLHIRDIQFPENVTSLDEDHLTIAIVAAPTVSAEAEEGEEEMAGEAAEETEAEKESEAEES
ncbi:MAG: 50S ribosomal protein L25/general stress protein Ctc [Pseudomonadota bacterium]